MLAPNELEADNNWGLLSLNSYPGRFIVLGMEESGDALIQVYILMGRSDNSRNRRMDRDGVRVFTELADPKKGGDTSLTLYIAMGTDSWCSVVSNGHQTLNALAD